MAAGLAPAAQVTCRSLGPARGRRGLGRVAWQGVAPVPCLRVTCFQPGQNSGHAHAGQGRAGQGDVMRLAGRAPPHSASRPQITARRSRHGACLAPRAAQHQPVCIPLWDCPCAAGLIAEAALAPCGVHRLCATRQCRLARSARAACSRYVTSTARLASPPTPCRSRAATSMPGNTTTTTTTSSSSSSSFS